MLKTAKIDHRVMEQFGEGGWGTLGGSSQSVPFKFPIMGHGLDGQLWPGLWCFLPRDEPETLVSKDPLDEPEFFVSTK